VSGQAPGPPVRAVVTDIEGTVSRISYVKDVLFPYARARLPDFLRDHGADAQVGAELDEVARLAPGQDVLATLLAWMDQDSKATPLKALQGMIWSEGFSSGALRGELYGDVPTVLFRWRDLGVRLFVYSSGSEQAQRLLFGHTQAGDLVPLFEAFFDTRVGPKREPASYAAIAGLIGVPAAEILFLSDVAAELEAAVSAGMQVCHVVRPEDVTQAGRFAAVETFEEVDRGWVSTQ
jgi:enolase-phosphatase E1